MYKNGVKDVPVDVKQGYMPYLYIYRVYGYAIGINCGTVIPVIQGTVFYIDSIGNMD